jgi:hypothetical protein
MGRSGILEISLRAGCNRLDRLLKQKKIPALEILGIEVAGTVKHTVASQHHYRNIGMWPRLSVPSCIHQYRKVGLLRYLPFQINLAW